MVMKGKKKGTYNINDPGFILGLKSSEDGERDEYYSVLLESLISNYLGYLIKCRYLNREDALDVVSDTVCKVIRHIDTYDSSQSSFKHWIYVILKNCANDKYNKNNKNKTLRDEYIIISEDETIDNDITEEDLREILKTLTEPHKQLLQLWLEERGTEEIVRLMKLQSISAYHTKKHRAIKELKAKTSLYKKNQGGNP